MIDDLKSITNYQLPITKVRFTWVIIDLSKFNNYRLTIMGKMGRIVSVPKGVKQ